MLYRTLRTIAVISLASLIAVSSDGQTSSKKKKKTTSSSTRSRAKKKTTARRPAAPAVPVVRFTSPRSVQALAADLGSMATRIRSGQFGIMAISLTRGDTLFAHNAGVPLLPASTMKMLTTAVALDRLGPKYQFSTDVLYDGTLDPDGTIRERDFL